MFAPQVYFFAGLLLVVSSLLLLGVALAIRAWFFEPDLRNLLQPIVAQHSHQNKRSN